MNEKNSLIAVQLGAQAGYGFLPQCYALAIEAARQDALLRYENVWAAVLSRLCPNSRVIRSRLRG